MNILRVDKSDANTFVAINDILDKDSGVYGNIIKKKSTMREFAIIFQASANSVIYWADRFEGVHNDTHFIVMSVWSAALFLMLLSRREA